MYDDILIIYSSKKKRRNLRYIQVHNYATVTVVCNKTMVKNKGFFLIKYNKIMQVPLMWHNQVAPSHVAMQAQSL